VSVAALALCCSVLINLLELFQILSGANTVFLGLTVLAWANSVGDYLTIVHFAKRGHPQTAVAGVFPGQLFNFYLGFSVSLVIQCINHGGEYEYKIFDFVGDAYDKISDGIVVSVIASGLIYLVAVLIVVQVTKVLGRREAMFARIYYFVFLLIASLLALASDFLDRDRDCGLVY
jgi:sodium/potassium/calcium exchanger 6